MKKHQLTLTPITYYLAISVVGFCLALYLIRAICLLFGVNNYQKFSVNVKDAPKPEQAEQRHQSLLNLINQAIRYDRTNPQYWSSLGSYLLEYAAAATDQTQKERNFQDAAQSLKHAALRDPANAWNYYELGRLYARKSPCPNNGESCLAAQYFLAAFQRAPSSIFMQRAVGRWLYDYDREAAYRLIGEQIVSSLATGSEPQSPAVKHAKFLYAIRADDASDLEADPILRPSADCRANIVRQSADGREIELGNDDGSAEWRVRLITDTMRVRKTICLPEPPEDYQTAVLKILMNSGLNRNFTAFVSVDDSLIKRYNANIPLNTDWYEIPFDKNLLTGKSAVNVYIRVTQASSAGNYLQIWGDQHTPATTSVLNFQTTDDLSLDDGVQAGEYMIRLVLRK